MRESRKRPWNIHRSRDEGLKRGRDGSIVEEMFLRIGARGVDTHDFHGSVPIVCGGDGAGVCSESDERADGAELSVTELTGVNFVAEDARL